MNTPTTAWDRGPTDKELNQFYGVENTYTTRNLIIETITKTVRKVDHRVLSVPYVKNAAALIAIFTDEINKTVARRASFSLYGDVSVLPVSEVTQ